MNSTREGLKGEGRMKLMIGVVYVNPERCESRRDGEAM